MLSTVQPCVTRRRSRQDGVTATPTAGMQGFDYITTQSRLRLRSINSRVATREPPVPVILPNPQPHVMSSVIQARDPEWSLGKSPEASNWTSTTQSSIAHHPPPGTRAKKGYHSFRGNGDGPVNQAVKLIQLPTLPHCLHHCLTTQVQVRYVYGRRSS